MRLWRGRPSHGLTEEAASYHPAMASIWIEVDEHDAIPDGCLMRFSALGPPRPIARIKATMDDGTEMLCLVEGRSAEDAVVPAWTAPVDDSSAGQAWLVGGGAHGLRLRPESGGDAWAEPYLLLNPDAIVGDEPSMPLG